MVGEPASHRGLGGLSEEGTFDLRLWGSEGHLGKVIRQEEGKQKGPEMETLLAFGRNGEETGVAGAE